MPSKSGLAGTHCLSPNFRHQMRRAPFLAAGLWLLPSGHFSGIVCRSFIEPIRHKVPVWDLWAESNSQNLICLFTPSFALMPSLETEKQRMSSFKLFIYSTDICWTPTMCHCTRRWEQNCEQHRPDLRMVCEKVRKRWTFLPLSSPPLAPAIYEDPTQGISSQPSFHKSPPVEPLRIQIY